MNLILFELAELSHPLPRADRRARHILDVLRRQVGDPFDAGVVDGPRGKATLTAGSDDALTLTFSETSPRLPTIPITLIVGLPRPQTARDILRDATTIGVGAIHFVRTEKSEASYAQSTLWSSGEWRRHLIAGAEQAFDTRLPDITHGRPLAEALATMPDDEATRLVLDNYESPAALSDCHVIRDKPVVLALGPERGWSAAEREIFRAHDFTLAHLGPRVLRTETAVTAALALVRTKLGLM
ncbi:MAG: 16S rRNA (uracil(1498)-N(3))-methyltransferase [Opitutus sp.]|nr:16S rRNA (uracil(1498)-N(3))-methyltransferase [Opitutus sp.]